MTTRCRIIAAAAFLLSTLSFAAQPAWWTDDVWGTRILQPDGIADNYAPANLGQLKWVATQARNHLEATLGLAGYSGPAIDALVEGFTPEGGHTSESRAANYAPANLGQLKAVAKVFYDRLITVGYNTRQNLIDHDYPADWPHNYPWDPSAPQNQPGGGDKSMNYAPANLGQLKLVFSFDLAGFTVNYDADGDGVSNADELAHGLDPWSNTNTDRDTLPDDWEKFWFLGLLDRDGTGNGDSDDFTDLEEYLFGLNPKMDDSATAAKVLSYDALGRLQTAGAVTYSYDAEGNLETAAD